MTTATPTATTDRPSTAATDAPAKGATLATLATEATRHRGAALRIPEPAGGWRDMTYGELEQRTRALANGLIALGIEVGDRVAILSATRAEWTLADLACLRAGATVVPIYHTSSVEEIEYLLSHSGAKAIFCEDDALLERTREARKAAPDLEHVIGFAGGAMTLDQLAARGAEVGGGELAARAAAVQPGDVCTIVYTSGTTGRPKGCMLTHANVRANMAMLDAGVKTRPGSVVFAFLPLAHVLTRMTQLVTIDGGGTLAYWRGDPDKLLDDLAEVRPTHLPSVPRVWQKAHARVTAADGLRGVLVRRAVGTGRAYRRALREGREPGALLAARHALADRLVLHKVRDVFGGRVERAFSGGAPIAAEVLELFDACGLEILEGWGMTETSAGSTLNRPGRSVPGTVGPPLPGCEVKIADDGEVLVRGPHIFKGYFRNEEATAETFDGDWLRTGDLGSIDPDGALRITGRKKELIITSSGKNIAPSPIENALTNAPILSQAVVFGEGKPYLVALLALDPQEAERLSGGAADPRSHPAVRDAVEAAVAAANDRFARIEQVKKWDLLERELTVDDGELTPTLKVKRPAVAARHGAMAEALYGGG